METRREFLTHSAGLLAGLSVVPDLLPLEHHEHPNAALLTVRNEIPRLVFELRIFRNGFLPTLLSPPISDVPANVRNSGPDEYGDAVAGLNHWRRATDDLWRALPSMNCRVPESDALEAFAEFHALHARCYKDLLEPPAERCFELAADWPPIRWRIPGAGGSWSDAAARGILSQVRGRDDDLPNPREGLARHLPHVRQMIRDFPADFNRLAWTYDVWLPALAELDPNFAIDALDYERLRLNLVGDGPAIGARATFLTDAFTTGVAFVAEALANNHFPKIRRLLEKPGIGGYWATVIPSLLSAMLYHKVVTLRDLARAD